MNRTASGTIVILMLTYCCLLKSACAAQPAANMASVLELPDAIHMAQTQDDWLTKSRIEQQRLMSLSKGAKALPDPTLTLGLLNLPTDGFAFDQEPMTQLKLGASQMFPRGDTLALQQTQLQQTAGIQPAKRADRKQKVAWQTTQLWLDAYQSQASYALVKDAEPLFEKLGEIVSAGYSASVGKANQQDLIRAELELARLQDRLVTLSTQQRVALSKLTQFLSAPGKNRYVINRYTSVGPIPNELQQIIPQHKRAVLASVTVDDNTLYEFVINHPIIVAVDQQIKAQRIGIDIAQQGHKPQFGVNTSYALRADAPEPIGGSALGSSSRADFFSIGVSVSLPLFSSARQDAQVASSIQHVEAIKTEKLLLLRELMAGLKSSIDQYQGASARLAMYREQILPQMSQHSDAALNAYTNDLGDFSEVVRAKIAELDAQITTIGINVTKRKALAAIQYYFSEFHGYDDVNDKRIDNLSQK